MNEGARGMPLEEFPSPVSGLIGYLGTLEEFEFFGRIARRRGAFDDLGFAQPCRRPVPGLWPSSSSSCLAGAPFSGACLPLP